MGASTNIKTDLLRLIQTPPGVTCDDGFNDLALRIFRHQFEHNAAYRQFSIAQKKSPDAVGQWEEIPALPAMAFKMADVACRPIMEAAKVFHSSGTTQQGTSRHPLFDKEISRAAILSHVGRCLMPEGKRMQLVILTPAPEESPHSSLSHMMEEVRLAFGNENSRYYIERDWLQSERIVYDLAEATVPVCLLGTSFSFVHLIDFYARHGFPCQLPAGSRLMDTGGFKGKSREVAREWIYAQAEKLWGIRPEMCVNEYGMTEMTSQFYDQIAGRKQAPDAPRVYLSPPQVRTRVLSLQTLTPVAAGEVGLLAHYDLANFETVAAILTDDLGHTVDGGIMLTGRAQGAERRGCSLTMEDVSLSPIHNKVA
jgi:hypothetical protein